MHFVLFAFFFFFFFFFLGGGGGGEGRGGGLNLGIFLGERSSLIMEAALILLIIVQRQLSE